MTEHVHTWSAWTDAGHGQDSRSCPCGTTQYRGNGKKPGQ